MYTASEIEMARKRQERLIAPGNERRLMKDGALEMRIDPVLYHNARIANEREHGVRDCWAEKEFVGDMLRRHPEIRVKSVGKTRIRIADCGLRNGEKRLTRFGRVTWHKVYA